MLNHEEETALLVDLQKGDINVPSWFLDIFALIFNVPHEIAPFLGMVGLDVKSAAQ